MFWNILSAISLIVSAISYVFAKKPEIPAAEAPNFDDFKYPSVDENRKIPEVFGTVKISPQIISFNNLRHTKYREMKMTYVGGGYLMKETGQVLGYSAFASLGLGLATKIDSILDYWKDDKIIYSIPDGVYSFNSKTGDNASIRPSRAGNSLIKYYNGYQSTYNREMASKTGRHISFNGVSYVFMPDAFLGDNVKSVPNYAFTVKRTDIYNNFAHTNINDGQINPAIALLYILDKFINLPGELIDNNNFNEVIETLYNEKLGMSFVISSQDEAEKWLNEILRHIDGSLVFNQKSGQYQIKLMRDDYDLNTLKQINENNSKDVKMTRLDWSETYTSVTMSYTDPVNFKKIDITKTNQASEIMSGGSRNVDIELMGISNHNTANLLSNRALKKYTYPRANFTLKLPSDIDLGVMDVFKFSSVKLGVVDMVVRILEIGGDKYNSNYIDCKCIEDIYSLGNYEINETDEEITYVEDYHINKNIQLESDIIFTSKDFNKSGDASLLLLDSHSDDSVITNDIVSVTGYDNILKNKIDNYSNVIYGQTIEEEYIIETLEVSRKDFMYEFELSDSEWQSGSFLISINNEIMSVKQLEFIDDYKVRLKRIIRNINNHPETLNNGSFWKVWFISNSQNNMELVQLPAYVNGNTYNLEVKLTNDYNDSRTFDINVYDYDNFHNIPYGVDYIRIDGDNVRFSPTNFLMSNTSCTCDSIDNINIDDLNEDLVTDNQFFKIYIKTVGNNEIYIETSDLYIPLNGEILEYIRIKNVISNIESKEITYINKGI